jgi:hypothetical protein
MFVVLKLVSAAVGLVPITLVQSCTNTKKAIKENPTQKRESIFGRRQHICFYGI